MSMCVSKREPESISKRAPSTTRTSLRFRINELRAVRNRIAQNASFTHIRFDRSCRFNRLLTCASRRERELCYDLLISRDHLRRSG